LFGDSDSQYTNGLKLGWMSPNLKYLEGRPTTPDWVLRLLRRLEAFENASGGEESRQYNLGFAIGQMIYTPTDTQTRALVPDDRPYAGWLYGAFTFVSKTDSVADTLALELGVVGPASLAEDAQRFVHDIRDIPEPLGWDNQLKNEPGVLLYYERRWRVLQGGIYRQVGYDVITHAGLALGNVKDYVAAGGEARIGWNLPLDFGTSMIRPGADANAPSAYGAGQQVHPFGAYLFAATSGRLVARDIFLDGNTFRDSHDVDKKIPVGDLILGASIVYGAAKLSYAQVFRSLEFDGQQHHHKFGSISFSLSF
jgi:hypothetical protein